MRACNAYLCTIGALTKVSPNSLQNPFDTNKIIQ